MQDSNRKSSAEPRRSRVRRIERKSVAPHGRGQAYIWRVIYRSPDWDEGQGPVTKLFGDQRAIERQIRKLRKSTPSRSAATILSVERVRVLGEWEEVDR